MRILRFALILCLFASGTLSLADDLSTVIHSCGKPATTKTGSPSDYEDGAWHRLVEYKSGDGAADWVVIGFTAHSKSGPWTYDHSKFGGADKLSCMASSGLVPTQTQAAITPPVDRTASNSGSVVFGFILIALAIVAYFVPTVVAMARNCKARNGIEVLNLFLGWTFIGWVVALAWAASGETNPKQVRT